MKTISSILTAVQMNNRGLDYTRLKVMLILFSLLFVSTLYAQNQANIWYMGNGAGLDFNSNPPVQLENGNAGLLTFTGEGVGSISDASGALQFYTNGSEIYDNGHATMPLGTGLNGNGNTTQTGLIVPVNGSTTQYFVISTNDVSQNAKYVIVDMSLPGNGTVLAPRGDVVLASKGGGNGTTLLASGKTEAALAIPEYTAGNVPTGEYWLLFHGLSDNNYYVFKTNGTSIAAHSTPVQAQGFVVPSQSAMIMKINSCFDKIATAFYNAGRVEVLPFNNITGILSTPSLILNGTGGAPFLNPEVYGVEFSPSGQFLYVSEAGLNSRKTIYQFDISAGTGTNPAAVLASKRFFTGDGSVIRFGAIQLGPDGKIYVPGYNTTTPCYVSVVSTPDVQWAAVTPTATEFQYLKYIYNVKRVGEGLPPVLKNLLTAIRIFYNNACEGGTTNFSYVFGGSASSISWDFGDPASGINNTSTNPSPSHIYATAGTYTVTLTIIDNCGRTRVGTVNVIVKTGPVVSVPANVCANTNVTLTGTGGNAANYIWSLNSNMSSPSGPSSTYVYNGTLPKTIYVQDPTPLATYTVGNSTASQTAGADIGYTYFELFTSVSITSFQVIARLNGQNATFTIRSEDLATTYYTVAAPVSVSGTTYTFNPNITLSPGRYVFHTTNVGYAFRNNTDDDGNRDVSGVIDVLGEKNGTKGGSFINIGLALPDPCGIKAINLTDTCPLPITLLNFYGEEYKQQITLFWNVSNEFNNNYFLIQRSANGENFNTIGQVQGRGTAAYGEYSFQDSTPFSKKNYYRLAQVDYNGNVIYSKIILIETSTFSGTIYPNPFSDKVTVLFNTDNRLSIEMIDITGRTVATYYKESEQTEITIGEGVANGTYLIRILSSDKVYTSKLIKD